MSAVKPARAKKTRAGAKAAAAAAGDDGSINPVFDDFESDLQEGTASIHNNGKVYDWRMFIGEFKPEEVKIWIAPSYVQISGSAETEEESSEFSQRVNLPPEVQVQFITCTLNMTGVLRIFAPVEPQALNTTTKIVSSSKTTQQVSTETTTESSSRTEEQEEEEEEEVEEVVEPTISDTDPVLDSRYEDSSKAIVKKGNTFEVSLDLPEFKKEDLKITVHKSMVTVQAKNKPKRSTGKLPSEAFKMFGLPEGTTPGSIKTTFKHGKLVISGATPVTTQSIKKTRQKAVVQSKAFLEPKGLGLKQDMPLETILDLSREEDTTDLKEITKIVTYESTGKKFEVSFDVAGFSPDDVQVKVFKNMITVRGEQKLDSNEYNENSVFYKKFTIPRGVNPANIQTTFTTRGLLRISSVLGDKPIGNGGVTIQEMETIPNKQPIQQVAILKPKIQKNDAFYENQVQTQTQQSGTMSSGPDEGRNFTRTLDISGYEPKDINVSIKNGWITVTGKVVKGVFDTFSDFKNKQFSRQYTVPHGIKPEEINFVINPPATEGGHPTLTISVLPQA